MKNELIFLIILISFSITPILGQENEVDDSQEKNLTIDDYIHSRLSELGPVIRNSNYMIENFTSGLIFPTAMTFVENDILVLQKNDGQVRLIQNGILQEEPVLTVNVNPDGEMGLLGITSKGKDVYLFFTEILDDEKNTSSHIYKYQWINNQLTNGVLIKKISLIDDITRQHKGGAMITHPDGTVYAVTGNNNQKERNQNYPFGIKDDSGVIIPVEPSGEHYAVGIRNSFGLAVDPLTGNIWDTENGPNFFDEINLVHPKFNSGWDKIMGPLSENKINIIPSYDDFVYSDPEFSWESTVGPTGLTFVESQIFPEFSDSLFVGDIHNGNLYEFKLNDDRTGFVFTDPSLNDLVANRGEQMYEIIFGTGFSGITDVEIGPDGLIYIVSFGDGTIYRITPSLSKINEKNEPNCSANFVPRINLSGCNLSNLSLQNLDLSFVNFIDANLSGANLTGSTLAQSNFTGADLRNTDLSNTILANTIFKDAKIQGSDLSGAEARTSIFEGANLENVKMNDISLRRVNLNEANLMNVDLSNAIMTFATFQNSNLFGANLGAANLKYTKFIEADLREANLSNTDIYQADFSSSDLSGANFVGVYPYSTDFKDVIFSAETKTDSCLGIDPLSRILNRALRELRQGDLGLEFLESLIIQICRP